jgi:hypothetical protein
MVEGDFIWHRTLIVYGSISNRSARNDGSYECDFTYIDEEKSEEITVHVESSELGLPNFGLAHD